MHHPASGKPPLGSTQPGCLLKLTVMRVSLRIKVQLTDWSPVKVSGGYVFFYKNQPVVQGMP